MNSWLWFVMVFPQSLSQIALISDTYNFVECWRGGWATRGRTWAATSRWTTFSPGLSTGPTFRRWVTWVTPEANQQVGPSTVRGPLLNIVTLLNALLIVSAYPESWSQRIFDPVSIQEDFVPVLAEKMSNKWATGKNHWKWSFLVNFLLPSSEWGLRRVAKPWCGGQTCLPVPVSGAEQLTSVSATWQRQFDSFIACFMRPRRCHFSRVGWTPGATTSRVIYYSGWRQACSVQKIKVHKT